jgi:hypothetical protein
LSGVIFHRDILPWLDYHVSPVLPTFHFERLGLHKQSSWVSTDVTSLYIHCSMSRIESDLLSYKASLHVNTRCLVSRNVIRPLPFFKVPCSAYASGDWARTEIRLAHDRIMMYAYLWIPEWWEILSTNTFKSSIITSAQLMNQISYTRSWLSSIKSSSCHSYKHRHQDGIFSSGVI